MTSSRCILKLLFGMKQATSGRRSRPLWHLRAGKGKEEEVGEGELSDRDRSNLLSQLSHLDCGVQLVLDDSHAGATILLRQLFRQRLVGLPKSRNFITARRQRRAGRVMTKQKANSAPHNAAHGDTTSGED